MTKTPKSSGALGSRTVVIDLLRRVFGARTTTLLLTVLVVSIILAVASNGTFLRPRRAVVLEPGDEILIGASVFRLEEAQG